MTDILAVTGPIFLMILLGFAVAKGGLLDERDFAALGKYVVTLALPALIFRAIAARPLTETINPAYVTAYALAGLVLIGLVTIWTALRRGKGDAIAAMGMVCPNSGFVGYPIMLLTFPDLAGTVLALNMAVETILLIPLLLFLAEHERHTGGSTLSALAPVFSRLIRMPLIRALGAGIVWSLTGWPLPGFLAKPVDMLAASSGAASLIVIGGTLARARFATIGHDVLPIVAGKLLLHPLLVAVVMVLLAAAGFAIADERMRVALLITAAMPIMGIYPVLAMRFGDEERAAFALVATTALSFLTVNALFMLLKFVPT